MAALEQWIKWEPITGLSPKYYIESISDNRNGFTILLSEADYKNTVKVTFETLVLSYRNTNESFRLSTIDFIYDNYGAAFCGQWTFFKVVNSAYVLWLSEQSYTIAESVPPIHFSFLAVDSIIDVVATCEPKVEFITDNLGKTVNRLK